MGSLLKRFIFFSTLLFLASNAATSTDDVKIQALDVGFTSSGHPYKGRQDAAVTLIEYSDYLCPFCARHQSNTVPGLLDKYVNTGKIRMEFRHFPLAVLHPTAHKGHVAAACAGNVSAEDFWKYHEALFIQQQEWNRLPEPSEFLISLAEHQGLTNTKWQNCFNENLEAKSVDEDIASGKSLEFTGTPTFQLISNESPDSPYTISGARTFEYFSNAIDALLAGEEPPAPPERAKPELPAWAKSDALAPDPDRPGFTVSGDPTYGSDDAALVIVEFTDYQCPACALHFFESQSAIDEELVVTGEVRWVSKHLPLPEHKNAMVAAAAVECAAHQGSIREMKGAVYRTGPEWADVDDPTPLFLAIAEEEQMDLEKFTNCLNSRESLEGVLTDVFEATTVTRSTPVFVLLDGVSGTTIRGAQSAEDFIKTVRSQLKTTLARNHRKPLDES